MDKIKVGDVNFIKVPDGLPDDAEQVNMTIVDSMVAIAFDEATQSIVTMNVDDITPYFLLVRGVNVETYLHVRNQTHVIRKGISATNLSAGIWRIMYKRPYLYGDDDAT